MQSIHFSAGTSLSCASRMIPVVPQEWNTKSTSAPERVRIFGVSSMLMILSDWIIPESRMMP